MERLMGETSSVGGRMRPDKVNIRQELVLFGRHWNSKVFCGLSGRA